MAKNLSSADLVTIEQTQDTFITAEDHMYINQYAV